MQECLGGGLQRERVRLLNAAPPSKEGRYVLWWVQQDVRAQCNHAQEFAFRLANRLRVPVVACYGLWEHFPEANERCFAFLLDGLVDLRAALAAAGVPLFVCKAPPNEVAVWLAQHAAAVVVDRGYTRLCRRWRADVARRCPVQVVQVETAVVVPVEAASDRLEPSAASLRPKIRAKLARFLVPLVCSAPEATAAAAALGDVAALQLEPPSTNGGRPFDTIDLADPEAALAALQVDRTVPRVATRGGAVAAQAALTTFVDGPLAKYANGKANDPTTQATSGLSAYLHFGHISPLQVALIVQEWEQRRSGGAEVGGSPRPASTPAAEGPTRTLAGAPAASAFLEELIVRRELARNFVWYRPDAYDKLEACPGWARDTLFKHTIDTREALYPLSALERGETADLHWNCAQWEMVATGRMHNYLRMYWCKQLLLWTKDAETAMQWALHLNNKYELDGRDENGYIGVAWCFGMHDRPFPERPIFGSVRPMSAKGLASKFDMPKYHRMVRQQCCAADARIKALLPKDALGEKNRSIASFFGKRPAPAAPKTTKTLGASGTQTHEAPAKRQR